MFYKNGECVELRASTVCAGLGVFATRDIARGVCVTAYAGALVQDESWYGQADYALQVNDGWTLVGHSDPSTLSPAGIAQMANDAIHPELAGVRNNCDFMIDGTSAHLRTTRAVRAGEELLVDYHISYWLGRSSNPSLAKETRAWLRCHKRVVRALERLGCTVDGYVGEREPAEDGIGVFVYSTTPTTTTTTKDGVSRDFHDSHDIPCTCPRVRRRRRVNVFLCAQDSGVPFMEVSCSHCSET